MAAQHNMFTGKGRDPVPVVLEGPDLEEALEIGDVRQDTDHGMDRIYILRKMNYGQRQKLLGIASRMQVDPVAAQKAQQAQERAQQRQTVAKANHKAQQDSLAHLPGGPPPSNVATLTADEADRMQTGQALDDADGDVDVDDADGQADQVAMAGMEGGFDIGAYNTELLVLNVVSWQGPSFVGMPVTRDNILDLDPDNMLVVKAVQQINIRNKRRIRQNPKG